MKYSALFLILFVSIICQADPKKLENKYILENINTINSPRMSACPNNMQEIEGDYCLALVQNCINFNSNEKNINGYYRCLEFSKSVCISKQTVHMHFCIDIYEWPNKIGEKPEVMVSWFDMKKNCESQGKRLCSDIEWTKACEGPNNYPYPYGYKRDSKACNIDNPQRIGFDATKTNMTPKVVAWLDQRVVSGSMPCVSEYGVYDMTGNVDEFVINSSGIPFVSGLKGGHWVKGARNRCRPETTIHGPTTVFYPIGGRCCQDIK